jgi:hypothetical protein
MLHSCGAVRTFIPDWLEMGLDILDPIQPMAKGMDPLQLKADFGNGLTFHGGIDAQHVLPYGTEEEVRQHTKNISKPWPLGADLSWRRFITFRATYGPRIWWQCATQWKSLATTQFNFN